MALGYKIVTIEDYADDAETEAALNAEGADSWDLDITTFQPNPSTGKSTGTFIFHRSISSSSVSSSSSSRSSSSSSSSTSSSSSSSSTSSSSSSVSAAVSSSFSDFTFMGTGWPYQPDEIEVTIGSRWREANVHFVEDEVIRLKRAPNTSNAANYSEDGSNTFNSSTNRLKIRIGRVGVEGATVDVRIGPNAGLGNFQGCATFDYSHPYNFGEAFNNSYAFTAYVSYSYFDITPTGGTGISPSMEWNGDVFKTFTFVDN